MDDRRSRNEFKVAEDIRARMLLAAGQIGQRSRELNENQLFKAFLAIGTAKRIVCSGVGKSGFVAQRTAELLAEIGVDASFEHPVEVLHGSLGRLRRADLLWVFSFSGTGDVVRLVQMAGIKSLGVFGTEGSDLEAIVDLPIDVGGVDETDHLGVIPTTSSMLMQAVADSLCMSLAEKRGLTQRELSSNHPGGWIGEKYHTPRVDKYLNAR